MIQMSWQMIYFVWDNSLMSDFYKVSMAFGSVKILSQIHFILQ